MNEEERAKDSLAEGLRVIGLATMLACYIVVVCVAGIILWKLFWKGLISFPDLIIVSLSGLCVYLFIRAIKKWA